MLEQKLLSRKRKATNENNQNLLISTCTDLAELYIKDHRYQDAIEEYTLLANIYKRDKKLLDYAKVNRGIGEALMNMNKFKKALEYEQIYLDITRKENNELEVQRALATIGHTYLNWFMSNCSEQNKNYLNDANRYFMKSLKVCESLTGINKFEQADMKARLFANLSLIQENLNNYETALELIRKSINLCKQHDIYEQLYRDYILIATIFEKTKQFNESIKHLNLAIEIAKKLHNKTDLICTALLNKSEILNKLGNFHASKQVLLKAYKLKSTNLEEHRIIEENLRSVASLCKIEDKLVISSENGAKLKKLYEKMGDNACRLKLYDKAVEYYNLMKDSVEKYGEITDEDLSTYYFSLGETYQDWEQYNKALEYFEKDYSLTKNKLKDALNSLSKIADIKECLKVNLNEMKQVYDQAFEHCRSKKNVKEEIRMVQRFIDYLERHNFVKEKLEMKKYMETLVCDVENNSESDYDVSDDEYSFENIDLDNLTDNSNCSSDDNITKESNYRPKRQCFVVKKNLKGESQLHTACIAGKMKTVRHLIELGHPLNVRDNCGWLPLHEACNNGHYEVVKFLLEKGAAINDRGGTLCNGITPLHDAASNGHLEIVKLLLDNGGLALMKADDGTTPLSNLINWKNRAENLTNEELTLYDELVERMSQDMEKIGEQIVPTVVENSGLYNKVGLARRNIDFSDNSDEETNNLHEGSEEYRQVMESLRNNKPKEQVKQVIEKQPALIMECDFDDWLEDDMGNAKKRKGSKSEHFERKKSRLSVDLDEDSYDSDVEFAIIQSLNEQNLNVNKKRKQSSLLNAGFTHSKRSATQQLRKYNSTPPQTQPASQKKQQSKLSLIRHKSNASNNSEKNSPIKDLKERMMENLINDPTLHVDVCIEGRAYRVPVLLSQIKTHTIKWLAEEAASRYASKLYTRPTLELETKNGAILSNNDLINVLFPFDAIESEIVNAKVIKWDLPPLINRYKQISMEMNKKTEDSLCTMLEELSISLNLNKRGLIGSDLEPLCLALCHQSTLIELDLSGNFLSFECVQLLAKSFPTLNALIVLNLSCTNLQTTHLAILSNCMPLRVTDLNLSDNLLNDASIKCLVDICSCLKLKKLNLSNVDFTENVFAFYESCELILKNIEELDISHNSLDTNSILKFISFTDLTVLRVLNISHNVNCTNILKQFSMLYTTNQINCKLKSLNLSRCCVEDTEVYSFLMIAGDYLETINLSYNSCLTGLSLRRLLEYPTLKYINLIGCENILTFFEKQFIVSRLETLKIHVDWNRNEKEIDSVLNCFGNKPTVIKKLINCLFIEVLK